MRGAPKVCHYHHRGLKKSWHDVRKTFVHAPETVGDANDICLISGRRWSEGSRTNR